VIGLDLGRASYGQNRVIVLPGGVFERGGDVSGFQIGVVSQDFLARSAAQPPNARPPAALFRIAVDAMKFRHGFILERGAGFSMLGLEGVARDWFSHIQRQGAIRSWIAELSRQLGQARIGARGVRAYMDTAEEA